MNETLVREIRDFLLRDFKPAFGELGNVFSDNPVWERLKSLGTDLWLDTANFRNISEAWTKEFSTVTTNNTLLYHEVQQGNFDALMKSVFRLLSRYGISDREMIHEMGFILRAAHALRIVEKFDAFVSLEVHNDHSNDPDKITQFGERLFEICPERFIASVPFNAAGIIASRRLSSRGIRVNMTLGFSVRQNYIAARLGRPDSVNVFIGRLNSLVKENDLGSGEYVGEKTALDSQRMLRDLRASGTVKTRQAGASFRNARQIVNLAGTDIMTMPPAVADAYRKLAPDQAIIRDRTGERYEPGIENPDRFRFDTLWNLDDELVQSVLELEEQRDVTTMTVREFETYFTVAGHGDVFPAWTPDQIRAIAEEGRSPDLSTWRPYLSEKAIGFDSLMTFAGLHGFWRDQRSADARIMGIVKELQQT